jgi:hypothetical protein
MAMRPALLALFPTALWALVTCTPAPEAVTKDRSTLSFQDQAPDPSLETIAVMTPLEPETQELWKALVLELTGEFNVETIPVTRATAPDDLSRELMKVSPKSVVVVDNRTLGLYRQLQSMRPQEEFPPAVVVMTSFLERSIGSLRRATGIAYEVPAVSSIVALREVAELDVQRVGVVHRRTFTDVVQAQAELAAVEKVELVSIAVSDTPTPEEVEDSLDLLVVDEKVDALWVLNDNRLLSADLLIKSWLPVLRFKPIPVIVGVSALVHPDVHFGTLAVLPQHAQLGVQTADLVFELADNDWQLEKPREVELPLSVMTVVDIKQVDDFFGLKPDALEKIDKAVK